ncbi:MAG: TIM barrel protein [Candidatus Rehaiarchaeum fermentans]|nr:sugar phosphate isomerase/epimerase [Candidatus Rehaiarchaeum fermentans]
MATYYSPKNLFGYSVDLTNQMQSFQQVLNLGSKLIELSLSSIYLSGRGNTAENTGKSHIYNIGTEAYLSGVNLTVHAPFQLDLTNLEPLTNSSGKASLEMYRDILMKEGTASIKWADELASAANQEKTSVVFHASTAPFSKKNNNASFLYDKFNNQLIPIYADKYKFLMSKEEFDKAYPEVSSKLKQLNLYDKTIIQSNDGIILNPETAEVWFPLIYKDMIKKKLAELKLNALQLQNSKPDLNQPQLGIIGQKGYIFSGEDINYFEKELTENINTLEELEKNVDKYIVPIDKVAEENLARNVAELALYSFTQTKTHPQVLVENPTSPEFLLYNPEEIAKSIDEARKIFVEEATKKGIPKSEAEKAAKDLIALNLDIGHLNLLKSTINPKTGKNYTDEDLIQIAVNVKDYIAKYHIADNLGYTDAHLPVGEGNAPIKEIYEKLKSLGVEAPAILEVFGKEGIVTGAQMSQDYVNTLMGVPGFPEINPLPYGEYKVTAINESAYSQYTYPFVLGLLPQEPSISYYLPPF